MRSDLILDDQPQLANAALRSELVVRPGTAAGPGAA